MFSIHNMELQVLEREHIETRKIRQKTLKMSFLNLLLILVNTRDVNKGHW